MAETDKQEAGFQIGKFFYPFPATFKLGDPVLVQELTGLSWADFVDLLPDEEEPADNEGLDQVAVLGLLGVAVQRQNPNWRRDRVIRYVNGVGIEEVEVVGPEDEEEKEEEERPPAVADGEPTSETSPQNSPSADTTSEESQPPSGVLRSVTGSA